MKRSNWKLPYVAGNVIKKLKKKQINLYLRNSTIPYSYVDKKIRLYNGIWFLTFGIKADMVGHKFGEFALTKKHDGQSHIRRKTKKKSKKR